MAALPRGLEARWYSCWPLARKGLPLRLSRLAGVVNDGRTRQAGRDGMDDFSALRAKMVDSQLKTEGVTDPAVLAAFAVVPRERFVPPRLKPLAYVDNDLLLKPADGV